MYLKGKDNLVDLSFFIFGVVASMSHLCLINISKGTRFGEKLFKERLIGKKSGVILAHVFPLCNWSIEVK